nr:MAG TPA: hypothetical protein [Caudoviricetes sp.]
MKFSPEISILRQYVFITSPLSFCVQELSVLLLTPTCVHFRHRVSSQFPDRRCWCLNFGHSAPAILGLSQRTAKHATHQNSHRNSRGIVPPAVTEPVVQVRIPPARVRPVVQVAAGKPLPNVA